MIMKGIPKMEIDAAMKRKEESGESVGEDQEIHVFSLSQGGHNLLDCPELGSEQLGTNICFKCGSTEHTHFEWKVAKPMEFRYATYFFFFICREHGHIAKQCPNNPKGIYSQGGSYKLCCDVTHLRKDYPDLVKEKEEGTIKVNTIAGGDVESLKGSRCPV